MNSNFLAGASENAISPSTKTHDLSGFRISSVLKKRWFYHLFFWLTYYVFYSVVIIFGLYKVRDPAFYGQLITFFPLDIALVYFNFYFLIPRFLSAKKYLYYILSLAVAMGIVALLNLLLKRVYGHLGSEIFSFLAEFNLGNITTAVLERFYTVGIATAFKLAKDWIQNQQRMKEREKHYLETELNFLKSQIQPHFFFNTLNNLYSLTLKKSDHAPEVVLKLSDIMSYMLYESNTPKVSLSKEIAYLQNYLDLEKLRFGQRLNVSFEMEGEIEEVNVPPLILILFVENSFKHGVKNIVNKIDIEISLKVEQGYIHFRVKNPVADDYSSNGTSGIGLKNVKRRLELLYGNNYSLDLSRSNNEYLVSLKFPVC